MNTIKSAKYRKKNAKVEAMHFVGTTADTHAVYLWIESYIGSVPAPEYAEDICDHEGVTIDPADGLMVIRTLEGDMKVSLGDWVIRGTRGKFYPLKPGQFADTFEPVDNDTKED